MRSAVLGRERVLLELDALLAGATAGSGSVVLLTGEAGIGKSTVADALVDRARAQGVPVLVGRAVADDGAPAYWPWRRALAAPDVGLSDHLLDADTDREPAVAEATAAVRFRVADRIVRALTAAAAPTGLVLLIEDVHWADEASLALLRHVCREVADAPILVLATVRTPAPSVPPVDLGDLPDAHVIRLAPFPPADVAAALAAIAEGPVHRSWPAYVHRLSGGNPLFVRELARLLAAEGRLATPAVDVPVPAELRRVALRRMARLGAAGQALLGVASVIGDEIDVALLTSAVDEDRRVAVPALVAEAVSAGVLVEDPDSPRLLRFSHELVRRARYDEMPRTERVGWHGRIADLLESTGSAPGAGGLAHHLVRAAVDEAGRSRAARACLAAADAAAMAFAFSDAMRWYDQATSLLDGLPDAVVDQAGALLAAADAGYRAGQFEHAIERCTRVMGVAERLRLADLAVAAAVVVRGLGGVVGEPIVALCTRARALLGDEDSARHALVLAQHAYALAAIDRDGEAAELSRRAMPMAERSGDPDALALALHAWYDVHPGPDGVAQRLAAGARLRTIAAGSGRVDAALWSYVWRVEATLELGAVDALDTEIVELAALVERLGWPLARWHLLRARTARSMIAARYPEAERYARMARETAAATQDFVAQGLFHSVMAELMVRVGIMPAEYEAMMAIRRYAMVLPVGVVQVGLLHLAAGDTVQATAALDQLRPALIDHPVNSRWLATFTMSGELAARLGDAETAAACYAHLAPYEGMYANSATGCHGSVARALGLTAGAAGDHDAAVGHLVAAVRQERRIGSLGDAAIAQVDLARALIARGRPGDGNEAVRLAEAAQRAADQFGMPPVRERADALLRQLAGRRADDPLTAREREIAALVAEGRSNRAIADQLFLSERTVETHIRNVLTKLGLANRTQVAGWFLHTPRR
ncbi:MAG TPA: AAA family ATPase [Micromonosporaceae bacterium]|nr:AAA family ATPase [Micromonosporaceae bacterium]